MIRSMLKPAAPGRNRFRLLASVWTVAVGVWATGMPATADIQQRKPGTKDEPDRDPRQENIRRAAQIPTPHDAAVTVLRGVPTRIVLTATAAVRQPVMFRLGDRPAHGTLSDPRASSEDSTKAVVTYVAGPGTASADSFTFRVKHRDTATSASATIRLRIVDPVAELSAPAELDFGEAVVGQTVVRPLVIKNSGTAAFSATLPLTPPWNVQQKSPQIWVDAGSSIEIPVAFTPSAPGEATTRVEFTGAQDVTTRLVGRALAPVFLKPSLVQLAWDATARCRRAVVTLTNRHDGPLDFTIAGSPRLMFSEERGSLPPRGHTEITVDVPLPDTGDLQSLLTVLANGVRDEVPLTAPPAPALLSLQDAEGWERDATDELRLPPVASPEGTIVFANEGGESAVLTVSMPPGWTSPGWETATRLGPGESRRVLMVPPEGRTSEVSGSLEARLGEERLTLKLTAPPPPTTSLQDPPITPDALLTAAPSIMTASSRRDLTADERQLQLIIDTLGIFPHDTRFDRSLPELQAVTLGRMKPDRIPLSLKSAGGEYTYVIFRDDYRPPPGGVRPTRHWLPIDGLKWKAAGDSLATTLEGLIPGGRLLLRFAVRTPDGRVGPPSSPIAITTPAPKPRRWGWLAAGVAAIAGFWWWRRSRAA